MDNVLYKLEVIKGKENLCNEWLEFLKTNREIGEKMLRDEKAYFEAYFKNIENDIMYVYIFFSCDNLGYSNNIAFNSDDEINKKHFKYMKECINFESVNIMNSVLYLNNFKDFLV